MSNQSEDHKKRPPPIQIPPLPQRVPAVHASRVSLGEQQQPAPRNASSSTQQGLRSVSSPLTSPLEHAIPPLPASGSQKSRTSAINALHNLIDEARSSPRKSDHGSVVTRSTTRSRRSARSRTSAQSGQALVEAQDDNRTSRGKMEARTEKNLFKMTGQVPPTPIASESRRNSLRYASLTRSDSVGENEVLIMTQDLREKCRAAHGEKKVEVQDPFKSPKKKIFGMYLPTFGRTSTPTLPMPSKAAQVFGQAPRNPTKAVLRPIKPAGPFNTPTKAPRSDAAKSLPAKLVNQNVHTHSHHTGATRRNREVSRRSPPRDKKQFSDTENSPPRHHVFSSFGSGPPPTPPAKDTPPEDRVSKQPASPLRRAAPSGYLREKYGGSVGPGALLPFPAFELTPPPTKALHTEDRGKSPIKHLPSNADEYQKLIAGQALPWASIAKEHSTFELHTVAEAGDEDGHVEQQSPLRPAFTIMEDTHDERTGHEVAYNARWELDGLQTPHFPRPDRRSDEQHRGDGDQDSNDYGLLQPRFYSPSNRSVQTFADGETPSKNSDTNRLLCTVTSKAELFRDQEDPNDGSIELVFHGDMSDINPQTSVSDPVDSSCKSDNNQESILSQARDDSTLAARVMKELRINGNQEKSPHQNGHNGHLQPDQSSSRLTDMLHGISPGRDGSQGRFQPNCPSAVPSPLHKMPGPVPAVQALPTCLDTLGVFGSPHAPRTIDDHFYMTNEHLDVVGKSTWDQIEKFKKSMHEASNNKHAQLVATIGEHVEEIKMQVNSVNEKADRTTEQSHNILTRLDKLFDIVKGDVVDALTAQDKKTASMEHSVKELHTAIQNVQKALEQKRGDSVMGQQCDSTPGSASMMAAPPGIPDHRSQPSLAGYYGNMADLARDAPPSMQDHRNSGDIHTESRGGYGSYGPQYSARNGYSGRGSKEDRPYSTTNPYQFSSGGMGGSAQFNASYGGGYAPYSQQSEPHYGYHSGPGK
ncbi:hypothetical protein DE146DRAFT_376019 [Phaeosphaeria sp. MPI-PUGE-AT-0046c]|nr:hypothetical protein DE146DRAFT_376019 [Phaeosphaeria sp. MPI-PUGE-AT-0046c]